MTLSKQARIESLAALGEHLGKLSTSHPSLLEEARIKNPWFTPDNLHLCLNNWGKALQTTHIKAWLQPYGEQPNRVKDIGIIMAGNIPLVGLHDLLAVLGMGHRAKIKPSHSDEVLMKHVLAFLVQNEPLLEDYIELVDRMNDADAVIATGSDNSSRYFEYYFRDIPHVIRKNRTGVSILTGNETNEQLIALSDDLFTYFGLGCRNVTKLYVPEGYNFTPVIEAMSKYQDIIHHHKFANNYTYHKAIFLMNLDKHIDTGFVLMKEDKGIHPPLGCIFYQFYVDVNDVVLEIRSKKDELQVVVGQINFPGVIAFGKTQDTGLSDFADEVNTLEFLASL